nr:uncharacterized protein LOC112035293 [Quercus suber]
MLLRCLSIAILVPIALLNPREGVVDALNVVIVGLLDIGRISVTSYKTIPPIVHNHITRMERLLHSLLLIKFLLLQALHLTVQFQVSQPSNIDNSWIFSHLQTPLQPTLLDSSTKWLIGMGEARDSLYYYKPLPSIAFHS